MNHPAYGHLFRTVIVAIIASALTACEFGAREDPVGVDTENQVVYVGQITDESGPGAGAGRSLALGTRLFVQQANAGNIDALPPGWRAELVERDHGYDPRRAMRHLDEIQDQVLFITSVFGTPNILALQEQLEEYNLVAFPSSLSSRLNRIRHTPPLAPSYRLENMRAVDWVVDESGGAENVRAAMVYQNDDFGRDGLGGWRAGASHHDVSTLLELPLSARQTDYGGLVRQLKDADAEYVMLTTMAAHTAAIIRAAARIDYTPVWLANTGSWSDQFLDVQGLDPAIFEQFHLVTALPYWGEDTAFFREFEAAFEAYTDGDVKPDTYILSAYVQASVGFEVFRRAHAAGDISRAGYMRALQQMSDFDAHGALPEALDYTSFPYVSGTQTRILRPRLEDGGWAIVADFARPAAL